MLQRTFPKKKKEKSKRNERNQKSYYNYFWKFFGNWSQCFEIPIWNPDMYVTIKFLFGYSTVPNCDLGANKRVGYYIGLFGYYIKNYFLFNNFF